MNAMDVWAARARRVRGLALDLLGLRKTGPRKYPERIGLICLIDLVQDADLILPIATAAAQSGRFEVRLVMTDWLDRVAPSISDRVAASGLSCERHSRDAVLNGLAPDLHAWDAVLTASETSAAPHRFAHALVQRTNESGLATFTLQHGLENVGLTYRQDGDHIIKSQWIFVWNSPALLPAWLDSRTRSHCIGVGRIAPQSNLPASLPLTQRTRPFVAVFENLHWRRYDDSYRRRFLDDLRASAHARPGLDFIVRPHPAGLFTLQQSREGIAEPNLLIADPHAAEWRHTRAADLIKAAHSIITTPSTVALDAAALGRGAAVAAYDLELPAYKPLPLLHHREDWLTFLDGQLDGDAHAFQSKHVREGDARPRILQAMLTHARNLRQGKFGVGASYVNWLSKYHHLSNEDRAAIRNQSAAWSDLAHTTIIIDARTASSPQIQATRRSIDKQLVSAVPTIVCRDSIGAALALARTPYAGIVEAGDLLAEHAIYMLVSQLRAQPEALFAYSDEDIIGPAGQTKPHFKPDWDCYRFRTQDYCCRLAIFDAAAARAILRENGDVPSVWELLRGMTEASPNRAVLHAPYVLHHRHTDNANTQSEARSKRVAPARIANSRHRNPLPLVSLIVPTRDRADLLRRSVDNLLATSYPAREIIIVDNGSTDEETLYLLRALSANSHAKVLRDEGEFNFSRLNNAAAAVANGALLGLVNNDVLASDPDWLVEMVQLAIQSDVGAVGAMLTHPSGVIQHAGCVLGVGGVASHVYAGMPADFPGHGECLRAVREVSAVTGACMLTTRAAWDAVGGLDEKLPVAYNDIDYCLKVRRLGLRVLWTPHARLQHVESASRGGDKSPEKRARLERDKEFMRLRWGETLFADPFYSPNLDLNALDARRAAPPRTRPTWRDIA
jgi:GT2 family glycosyltransferase